MIDIDKLKHTGQVTLPSLFTIGNMAFGFFAIFAAFNKEFSMAGWFIIGSMVMDALDGRIARLVNGESSFGVEMDSLADFLSFALAPAFIMYMFHLKDFGFWGYPVAFVYALCGALRLARFNVLSHEGKASKQYFAGLPVPAAAGILASFVILYSIFEINDGNSIDIVSHQMPLMYNIMPFVMIALGLLMVSTIPYAAFKQSNLLKPKTLRGMLFIVAILFVIIRYPQDSIFLLFLGYAVSGVIALFWRAFKNIAEKRRNKETPCT